MSHSELPNPTRFSGFDTPRMAGTVPVVFCSPDGAELDLLDKMRSQGTMLDDAIDRRVDSIGLRLLRSR